MFFSPNSACTDTANRLRGEHPLAPSQPRARSFIRANQGLEIRAGLRMNPYALEWPHTHQPVRIRLPFVATCAVDRREGEAAGMQQ
jgi:hypothetical protein